MYAFISFNGSTKSFVGKVQSLSDKGFRHDSVWVDQKDRVEVSNINFTNITVGNHLGYFHTNGNTKCYEITEEEYNRVIELNSVIAKEKVTQESVKIKENKKEYSVYSINSQSDVIVTKDGGRIILD